MSTSELETKGRKRNEAQIRLVKESDIPALIELFKLNYGDGYPHYELANERLVEHLIHDPNIIWLVLDDNGVAASGALILNQGRSGDQNGTREGEAELKKSAHESLLGKVVSVT